MKSNFFFLSLVAASTCLTAFAQETVPSLTSKNLKSVFQEEELATPSLFFTGATVFSSSQNFLAPQSGTQVELGFQRAQYKLDAKSENGYSFGTETNDQQLTADVALAISQNLFFGLNFNTKDSNSSTESTSPSGSLNKSTSKSSGTSDPAISINGRLNGSAASIIMGANFGLNTGEQENGYYGNDEYSSNNKLGGTFVTPRLSVFTNDKNSNIYGLFTAYTFFQDRSSTYQSRSGRVSKETISDGNQWFLSTFFETPKDKVNFGGSLSYLRAEEATTRNENIEDKGSAASIASLTVYSQIKLNRIFALIPSLSYGRIIEFGSIDKDQSYLLNAGLQARASF